MKRMVTVTVLSALLALACAFGLSRTVWREEAQRSVKVGFVHVDDAANAYTENFISAAENAEHVLGDRLEIVHKYNIPADGAEKALRELADAGCELIFSTSAGYSDAAKTFASEHPEIEVCQATGSNANDEPLVSNYHTFMGEIYEGRYAAGVVAGMKLQELIADGEADEDNAKVGYVTAFANAEVISGYTAFILGVRSVVPQALMEVVCTNTWSNYSLEKMATRKLIEDGCKVISQHTDTYGPAVACEESAAKGKRVYHVGYNSSMVDVAPNTSLTSCRINWSPYIITAIQAVLKGRRIEDCLTGSVHIHGNDAGAGFAGGWVEMLELNEEIAPDGTTKALTAVMDQLKKGRIEVFKGDYIGMDPTDHTDTIDLREGYTENADASAPSFHYNLRGVIITAK